jgi:hypothetical protein
MKVQVQAWPRLIIVAVGVGLVLGVLTQIGQSVLPEGLGQVANSISVWVAVAFFVGIIASHPHLASVAGFATLVSALIGYYGMIWIRFGYTGGGSSLVLWTVGALLGGVVYGTAGWYWRWTTGNARIAAIALLAAVFAAEGLYLLVILPEKAVGVGFIVAGLAVPLLLGSSRRERAYAWLGLLPALLLGALGYVALSALSTALAGF